MKLTTEADLAAAFGITPEQAADLRRTKNWPHVRLTRFDVRYTDMQVEQIVASHSVTPKRTPAEDAGLTKRSAARAS
ncbi:MAG: hypothetical protein ACXVXP_00340 [Mycobacteriaceae bacterium]